MPIVLGIKLLKYAFIFSVFKHCIAAKRTPGKSKQQAQQEKRVDLEKRLQDVNSQLGGPPKKPPKKGTSILQRELNKLCCLLFILYKID